MPALSDRPEGTGPWGPLPWAVKFEVQQRLRAQGGEVCEQQRGNVPTESLEQWEDAKDRVPVIIPSPLLAAEEQCCRHTSLPSQAPFRVAPDTSLLALRDQNSDCGLRRLKEGGRHMRCLCPAKLKPAASPCDDPCCTDERTEWTGGTRTFRRSCTCPAAAAY